MTPQTYLEQNFEEHIEEHLLGSGYIKYKPTDYDKDLCLIAGEVLEFIKDTQSKEFEKLEKQYGTATPKKLMQRLSTEVSKRGILDVLRKGFKDRGAKFRLAYYKPSSGMNKEHLENQVEI